MLDRNDCMAEGSHGELNEICLRNCSMDVCRASSCERLLTSQCISMRNSTWSFRSRIFPSGEVLRPSTTCGSTRKCSSSMRSTFFHLLSGPPPPPSTEEDTSKRRRRVSSAR